MRTKCFAAVPAVCLLAGIVFAAAAHRPDLTVSKVKVDSSKACKSGKVIVLYTVKNTGKVMAPASLAKISENSGKERIISTPSVPALAPGTSYSGQAVYTVTSKKNYRFSATADYNNQINETNEINNQNSVSFSFGKAF